MITTCDVCGIALGDPPPDFRMPVDEARARGLAILLLLATDYDFPLDQFDQAALQGLTEAVLGIIAAPPIIRLYRCVCGHRFGDHIEGACAYATCLCAAFTEHAP
jgi:hypothetical protein